MVVVSSLIGSGGVGSGKVGASAWRGPDAVALASAGRSRQRAQASGRWRCAILQGEGWAWGLLQVVDIDIQSSIFSYRQSIMRKSYVVASNCGHPLTARDRLPIWPFTTGASSKAFPYAGDGQGRKRAGAI
jgi:hypothetical protein